MPEEKLKASYRFRPRLIDRVANQFGYIRRSRLLEARAAFEAAKYTRLNSDWLTTRLSGDQELRMSLGIMRRRSRNLANNNDYVSGLLTWMRNNVMGPNGITLQMRCEKANGDLNDKVNDLIEKAFIDWGKKANCCINGRMTWIDVQWLFLRSLIQDGEVFVLKHPGYAKSAYKFALQFIDPDQVDHTLNKPRGFGMVNTATGLINTQNEVRLGVEVDEDFRSVAYYVLTKHPSEGGIREYTRVPAENMIHAYLFRRVNDTRGVPWIHTATERLYQLARYEEAELVAARISAAKMGFFISKTGEDLTTEKKEDGSLEITVEPGSFQQLPEGQDFKAWDPQHPNIALKDFIKVMLRAIAVGVGMSYNTLAGDYESVNFSSLRAAKLDERELCKAIQRVAIDHFHTDVIDAWGPMALTSGTLKLPKIAWSEYNFPNWRPRGWPWVDPLKDAQANILQLQNNTDTLENICAEEGMDWEQVLRQRAKEIARVKELGLDVMLNPTKPKAPGSGSQPDGDLAEEGEDGDTTKTDDADSEADSGGKKK